MNWLRKLHFTTLNYTPNYTLYPKLFEWTFYTLNYDIFYTLYPNVKFTMTECSTTWLPHDYCLSVTRSKDPNALLQFQRPKRHYTDPRSQSFPLTHNLVFWVSPCTDPHRSAKIKLVSMGARFDLGFALVMTQN